jgi:hypothetical protein
MHHDAWDRLLALKTKLVACDDRQAVRGSMPPDEAVIEVYADDVEQAMFVVAANRMADLLSIACFRVDIEDGQPQMIVSFGSTTEDAKRRIERLLISQQREAELSLDE